MLFVNLDLILELFKKSEFLNKSLNKLKYYNVITDTTLEEDITFNQHEQHVLDCYMDLEFNSKSLVGKNISDNIRSKLNIFLEEEKDLFTKLFVRDYLINQTNNKDLELANSLDAVTLFKDFASMSLKNDKEFAKVIIELDGSYIKVMGESIRNNKQIMNDAINNDFTYRVDSFITSYSDLYKDSDTFINYLKRLKFNQKDDFSPNKVYEDIFLKKDNKYVTNVFKNNEQEHFLDDPLFLESLVKIDSRFSDFIIDGRISKISEDNPKIIVK